MRNDGFVFTSDLMLAFVVVCTTLFIIVWMAGSHATGLADKISDFSEQRERVFFMDYLVKTHGNEMPAIGAAFFDSGKRRVMENVIDTGFLAEATAGTDAIVLQHSVVNGIFSQFPGEERLFFFGSEQEGCMILERFVVFSGMSQRKGKVGAVFCEV